MENFCFWSSGCLPPSAKTVERPSIGLHRCSTYRRASAIAALLLSFHALLLHLQTPSLTLSEFYLFLLAILVSIYIVSLYEDSILAYHPLLLTWSGWLCSSYLWKTIAAAPYLASFYSAQLYWSALLLLLLLALLSLTQCVQHDEWIIRCIFAAFLLIAFATPRPPAFAPLLFLQAISLFTIYSLVNVYVEYETLYNLYKPVVKVILSAPVLLPVSAPHYVLLIAGPQILFFGILVAFKHKNWSERAGSTETYLPTRLPPSSSSSAQTALPIYDDIESPPGTKRYKKLSGPRDKIYRYIVKNSRRNRAKKTANPSRSKSTPIPSNIPKEVLKPGPVIGGNNRLTE